MIFGAAYQESVFFRNAIVVVNNLISICCVNCRGIFIFENNVRPLLANSDRVGILFWTTRLAHVPLMFMSGEVDMIFAQHKKQVLVVDSDTVYCADLVKILEEGGFDVLTSSSAQGVIQKATVLQIDLVIVADVLTDANGFDVCDTLKKFRNTQHIPVIMLSLDFRKIRRYDCCADDYISRDFTKDELLARIEAVWRRGTSGFLVEQRRENQKQVIHELLKVIEEGLVTPHFQPIYSLNPFRLFGFEVFSRPSAGRLLKTPADLFQAAMKYNMYYALEMMCWRKALDIVSRHTRSEHVFLNCSPYMVENQKFAAVRDIFENSHVPFDNVVLEITERSSVNEQDLYYDRLGEYRDQGFRFAVDDVGAGYASLESIAMTKPEIVKIDAHIVRNVHEDAVKRSIIKFIVAFCRENAIDVVAEGVETQEEMDAVVALGVSAVQGYYLYRPVPDLDVRKMKDACICFA
jgi:EAL domain-containing protein (putative c-di-GMP-specific phosphodiesterase class I)/CheY-like chemotaxis protein